MSSPTASLKDLDLSSKWTLQCHSGKSSDWTAASYIKQFDTDGLADLAEKLKLIPDDKFTGSYLCFMRGDIMPLYEAPENEGGQSVCIKIPRENIRDLWMKGIAWLITENVFRFPHLNAAVNGMILSPKRDSSIMQIWVSSSAKPEELTVENLHDAIRSMDDPILFKPHADKPKTVAPRRPGGYASIPSGYYRGRGRGRGRGGGSWKARVESGGDW